MKLEYLDAVNKNGDKIIRLYNFDSFEADKFRKAIIQTILENKINLALSSIPFIQSVNCNLTFRLADSDIGITTRDMKEFFCDLTKKAFEHLVLLLEPFCIDDKHGYQWLYDTNSEIELLFSPDGKW